MTEIATTPADRDDEKLRMFTLAAYGLYALGLFFFIPWIVGVCLAYIKRGDAAGTIYRSHFDYLIRTFWIGLMIGVVGMLLLFAVIGFPIMIAGYVWVIYRLVKGTLGLVNGNAMDALAP